jgi:hypothetical protein
MGLFIKRYCHLDERRASVDGRVVATATTDGKFLTALYRSLGVDYTKFFKMDNLSRLGFLASELILDGMEARFTPREEVAVLCFNRSSSLESDALFQETIRPGDDCFPSPARFVYTLPNIVTAEITIRNKFHGETAFYVLEAFNAWEIHVRASEAFQDEGTREALVAWVESFGGRHEIFMMWVVEGDDIFDFPFSAESIVELLNRGRNG